ncbi:cytochrome c biogenesis protein DipZ [Patescibacteria group bacterium]|nr:cytochrome c biogenesis protein DipZ [Patescibacteria group bacterium]
MSTYLILFIAGILTILLPCILPLIPIVLGVSIAGRSKWRPLLTVLGMVVSFVGFTFLLLVALRQFVEVADYMRIGTYYILLLFGLGFVTHNRLIQDIGALLGASFFIGKGWPSVGIAAVFGIIAMHIGGRVATWLQTLGTGVQTKTREDLGTDNPATAFIMGLTMGLVWVPCAGPALGFAFTLVREQPGLMALLSLLAYGLGTAVPLLLIGYGGQAAVHSVHALSKYSGRIKQVAGVLLIATAIAFQLNLFLNLQTWLVENTNFGTLGTDLEEQIFGENQESEPAVEPSEDPAMEPSEESIEEPAKEPSSPSSEMNLPKLPTIIRAPEFTGLGPWHNADPFTLESLKGKVVLIDFWTYSCINCIRTLPYIQGYWEKFQDKPFVLLGVHTPEFVFEKSESNVADAIKRHGLTYPVAQDNDFGTWKAFSNRYWPAKYLIDAEGYIRYTHFGEGGYDETDLAIQSLLNEIGAIEEPMDVTEDVTLRRRDQTPETYLGKRSWNDLGNGSMFPSDEVVSYDSPESLKLHNYYLVGDWQLADDERQVLRSGEGEIRMKFLGSEMNLVMGLEDGAPSGSVSVEVDGEPGQSFTVDRDDLYNIFVGEYGEHEVMIRVSGKGVEGYAFTFGSN